LTKEPLQLVKLTVSHLGSNATLQ